jgi:hypothetical protein
VGIIARTVDDIIAVDKVLTVVPVGKTPNMHVGSNIHIGLPAAFWCKTGDSKEPNFEEIDRNLYNICNAAIEKLQVLGMDVKKCNSSYRLKVDGKGKPEPNQFEDYMEAGKFSYKKYKEKKIADEEEKVKQDAKKKEKDDKDYATKKAAGEVSTASHKDKEAWTKAKADRKNEEERVNMINAMMKMSEEDRDQKIKELKEKDPLPEAWRGPDEANKDIYIKFLESTFEKFDDEHGWDAGTLMKLVQKISTRLCLLETKSDMTQYLSEHEVT